MTTADVLLRAWDWEPSVMIGCAALAAAYVGFAGSATSKQRLCFFAGILLLLADLVSPIDVLGDEYLFSAHIAQHFILALLIPPLFLLGTPRSFFEKALERPFLARFEHGIARPPVSWMLGAGTMIFWHVPAFFNAALANEGLHIIQHVSFLVTGVIFWWPVLSPSLECRLAPFAAVSYLFTACLSCSLLGAALTFASPGLYPAYLNPEDHLGIVPLVRDQWGLDPRTDQQLGGLLMWIPGCFVYLTGILAAVTNWYEAAPVNRII